MTDQYEVEPSFVYSGSYTDTIFRGSIFNNSDQPISGNRIIVGLKTTGTTSNFNKIYHLYSDLLLFVSGGQSAFQKHEPFVTLLNNEETYYDSLVASPIDYFLEANPNVESALGIAFTQSGSDIFNIPETPTPAGGKIAMKILFASVPASSFHAKTSNSTWYDSYPFESKYKNIFENKIFQSSIVQPQNYTINRDIFENVIVPVSSSNFLAGVLWVGTRDIDTSLQHILESVVHPTASQNDVETEFVTPTFALNQKATFAIGDGDPGSLSPSVLKNIPSYIRVTGFGFSTKVFGLRIRGWKYGLINALPQNSKAIYRRGHYGQFRDMLEQRNDTKFLSKADNKFSVTNGVVTINFVSGTLTHSRSLDYVTNTSPDYDLTDTGFFDKQYRAGQPFFDTR